jgi:hypothetical protein
MKDKLFRLVIILSGILAVMLFGSVECNESKDDPNNLPPEDPCGPLEVKYRQWDNESYYYDPYVYFMEEIEGRMYYQFSFYVPEACHKKHAKIEFIVTIEPGGDFRLTPRADYSIFYQVPGQFTQAVGSKQWKDEINFGMQHAFPDDQAAFFWGIINIDHPDLGDTQANIEYFRNHIHYIGIQCSYYKYKAPAD